MNNQTPCSDYVETSGIIFFARMLDKVRLNAQGLLPDGYNLGFSDPTSFDARFCRFWEIDYDRLAAKTLEGGTNEELLEWCFQGRKRPNQEQILVWNSFIIKRGWRDDGAPGLIVEKELNGFANRDDIQTYVDLHDADEGRTLKHASLGRRPCRADNCRNLSTCILKVIVRPCLPPQKTAEHLVRNSSLSASIPRSTL